MSPVLQALLFQHSGRLRLHHGRTNQYDTLTRLDQYDGSSCVPIGLLSLTTAQDMVNTPLDKTTGQALCPAICTERTDSAGAHGDDVLIIIVGCAKRNRQPEDVLSGLYAVPVKGGGGGIDGCACEPWRGKLKRGRWPRLGHCCCKH